MANALHRWTLARRGLILVGLAAALAGCGKEGFVRDSVVEDPAANAFLTQVGKQCGNLNVGTGTINWLLQSQDDIYFVDLTTKLFLGDMTRAKYKEDINSFYPVGDSSRAVECIFGQLPQPSSGSAGLARPPT
jgi:hypothetical protein